MRNPGPGFESRSTSSASWAFTHVMFDVDLCLLGQLSTIFFSKVKFYSIFTHLSPNRQGRNLKLTALGTYLIRSLIGSFRHFPLLRLAVVKTLVV